MNRKSLRAAVAIATITLFIFCWKSDIIFTAKTDEEINLTILCRLYHGSALEYYNVFSVGYKIFWPKLWTSSDLVLVFDDESEIDHRFAVTLANIPPYPKIKFEKKPSERTFCDWRSEGYSRQQYSNFYSDAYTDKEFIGIVDTDSFFVTPVTPKDIFIEGKPRIIGYNGYTSWSESLQEIFDQKPIGEFMVVIGFPVVVRRKHFKMMREFITRSLKVKTFEEAWFTICTKYSQKYSQFDIIAHYLWFHQRDEYSWHFVDGNVAKHPAFAGRVTEEKNVLEKNEPIIGLMKHFAGKSISKPVYYYY